MDAELSVIIYTSKIIQRYFQAEWLDNECETIN